MFKVIYCYYPKYAECIDDSSWQSQSFDTFKEALDFYDECIDDDECENVELVKIS